MKWGKEKGQGIERAERREREAGRTSTDNTGRRDS